MEEQAAEDIENLKAGKPLGDKRHHIHNKLPGFYLNVTLPKALVYIYYLKISIYNIIIRLNIIIL